MRPKAPPLPIAAALAALTGLAAAAAAQDSPLSRAEQYLVLAHSAAMAGRKAATLAAVESAAAAVPLEGMLASGDSGWMLTPRYASLVRFGLWDEMIAVLPPDARAPGLTAGYLYARGVALAARGRLTEAHRMLADLEALAGSVPAEARAGHNRLRDVLRVAAPVVAARIAASEARPDDAIRLLGQAVAAEDRLAPDEPVDWFFPVRHLLGAQLLESGHAVQAERVYRADLERNPANGWALFGLEAALRKQRRMAAAASVARKFDAAWRRADVRVTASAFWFPGPDTTRCECERAASR